MSAEGAALIEIALDFVLCRTFGAHLNSVHYPGLTAGPTIFRPYGPDLAFIPLPGLTAGPIIFGAFGAHKSSFQWV